MQIFHCPVCGARVFFDDQRCVACGTALGYHSGDDEVVAIGTDPRCRGFEVSACPWVPLAGDTCPSCAMDVDLGALPAGDPEVVTYGRARRRVVRQFGRLGLDAGRADPPLRFALERSTDDHHVVIGHADGLVTLDLAEADPVTRETNRRALGEPYRTPLGHVRHESGHWHWQAFVASDPERLERCREVFGDDRADYADALARHYARDDDGSWALDHISSYASAHPWEDYAESFAHVLHLLDTLETARSAGLAPVDPGGFDERYRDWVEVTVTLNELSRSMGVADAYPFAPSERVLEKLRFVHDLLG